MFTITTPALPGAVFFSHAALREHVQDRFTYNALVAAYAQDRDCDALSEGLRNMGYEVSDIEWHLGNPGQHMPEGFY